MEQRIVKVVIISTGIMFPQGVSAVEAALGAAGEDAGGQGGVLVGVAAGQWRRLLGEHPISQTIATNLQQTKAAKTGRRVNVDGEPEAK